MWHSTWHQVTCRSASCRTPIPLDGPIDLERLDEFLASDRAPAECMQLSELDGFLTGVAVGPELIPPSVWLPMIWHDDEPGYADMEEAQTILGIIMRRYNEIIRLVRFLRRCLSTGAGRTGRRNG